MNRGFVLDKCIYHKGWFINYKDDYPFCEDCMMRVEKGLDASTIPTKEFNRVKEILEITTLPQQGVK